MRVELAARPGDPGPGRTRRCGRNTEQCGRRAVVHRTAITVPENELQAGLIMLAKAIGHLSSALGRATFLASRL